MADRSTGLLLGLFSLVGIFAPASQACPVCASPTAVEVRTSLADDVTPKTLVAIVLPFAVVAGVVSAIHFGLPGSRRKP